MKNAIAKPTLGRFVILARLLEQLEKTSVAQNTPTVVTSAELEKLTGWTRDTIRRDISLLNANCATVNGYDVSKLRQAINRAIALPEHNSKCCLVGLGRLGEALIEYRGFENTPFSIVAGFDSNVNRTEILTAPFPLYPTTRMQTVIQNGHIEYAILAVPETAAQQTAEKLVTYGIRGIVNFTPAVLTLPQEIVLENVSVLDALQKIAAKRSRTMRTAQTDSVKDDAAKQGEAD